MWTISGVSTCGRIVGNEFENHINNGGLEYPAILANPLKLTKLGPSCPPKRLGPSYFMRPLTSTE